MGVGTRSKQLAKGITATAGDNYLYTVPAGYTTIIKDIRLLNSSSDTMSPLLLIQSSGGSRTWFWNTPTLPNGASSFINPIWVVMESGDELDLFEEVTGLMYVVSGAELIGTT